jgi:3-hydroxyacyl-[acyl-carrier-protein] dehydratase
MRWYWIDRFLEFQRGKRAVAIKCVATVEEEIENYSPGLPHLPFALIIEGMAQTAGLLIGEKNGFEDRVVLAKVNKAAFHRPAFPGDTLRYTALVQDIQRDGAIASITAHIGDELQAEVEMMFAFLDDRFPKGPLFDPVDFLMMIRSFGLYDVGKQEDGSPIEVPEFYREAEAAAHASYEPTRGPVTISPKKNSARPKLAH